MWLWSQLLAGMWALDLGLNPYIYMAVRFLSLLHSHLDSSLEIIITMVSMVLVSMGKGQWSFLACPHMRLVCLNNNNCGGYHSLSCVFSHSNENWEHYAVFCLKWCLLEELSLLAYCCYSFKCFDYYYEKWSWLRSHLVSFDILGGAWFLKLLNSTLLLSASQISSISINLDIFAISFFLLFNSLVITRRNCMNILV